jgi:catechol 2,3-dioxygenase-like lactoylglutathione lyase family enzyme
MPSEERVLADAKLDHVMIMVHDLRGASEDYRKLGFRVRAGSRFPVGIENSVVPFGVGMPYLELVGIYQPGGESIRDNEEFLAQGEGAMYVGLAVTSVMAVAKDLRALGVDVPLPDVATNSEEGGPKTPPPLWRNVTIPHGSSPRADPIFFVEYGEGYHASLLARDPKLARKFEEERRKPHPNGAVTVAAVWLAVEQLEAAVARYVDLGFRRAREFRIDHLQARAVELVLGRGSLLVVESVSPNGPVRKLLEQHGFGIEVPGVSIEVPSVDRAIASMDREVSARLRASTGRSGHTVMISPDLTHGVWIELAEPVGTVG